MGWGVASPPVSCEIATSTVNRVSGQEQFGAYEPVNVANQLGVRLGFHF